MPQMSPYNWLNLFCLFSLTFYYFISFSYFTFLNMKIFKKKKSLNKMKPWVW